MRCLVQIETLKVGWCKIGGADGAKAVADLLMFNTSLQLLDLRGNGLGNDGAVVVSRALREHTNEQLRELDLGYNEIKDDGACAIAQVRARVKGRMTRGGAYGKPMDVQTFTTLGCMTLRWCCTTDIALRR